MNSNNVVRFRGARSDASVAAIRAAIERTFDVAKGSVTLLKPNGKKIRKDATIASLREFWRE